MDPTFNPWLIAASVMLATFMEVPGHFGRERRAAAHCRQLISNAGRSAWVLTSCGMCGSATFATEVSSTSMNVASITDAAITTD